MPYEPLAISARHDRAGPSYLEAYHTSSGHYVAYEYIPQIGEGADVHRESPSDLVDAIVATWPPITVYVGADVELGRLLREWLPAPYEVRAGEAVEVFEEAPSGA